MRWISLTLFLLTIYIIQADPILSSTDAPSDSNQHHETTQATLGDVKQGDQNLNSMNLLVSAANKVELCLLSMPIVLIQKLILF